MMTIWKFALEIKDEQIITMPASARVLTVQTQGEDSPCIWAMVHPDNATEKRKIRTFASGDQIDFETRFGTYLGTYQISAGALVFHVFDWGKA